MSNPSLGAIFMPFKKIELVKKITKRTQEGKITWQKTETGASAYVPGALRMNFVEAPFAGILSGVKRWVIFAVRDETGNELLKVENQYSEPILRSILTPPPASEPNTSFLAVLAAQADPLVSAVEELHRAVWSQQGKEGVDRAIDFLDKM
jgi:hypothetical protein